MTNVLTTNRSYVLPGTYIGEDIEPSTASVSAEARVVTYVGRGSSNIVVNDAVLTRGFINGAVLAFTASSPFTATLKVLASGDKDTATLVDGNGAEVSADKWLFNDSNTGVVIADSAYNAATTYTFSYQGADASVPEEIPTADILAITAVGSSMGQDQYKRNEDYYVDVVVGTPSPTKTDDGEVKKLTNATYALSSIAHTGTGTGVVAYDAYAEYSHNYTRSYELTVVSIDGTKTTFSWASTPVAIGNATQPAVPLTPAIAAPTFIVDSADSQTQSVLLENGIRVVVVTGSFVAGDTYVFTAYGPALLENDPAVLNTNQFATASAAVNDPDNVSAGSLAIDGSSYTGATNLSVTAEVINVDSGSTSATLPMASLTFTGTPVDGAGFKINNGRTGSRKALTTFEFDNNSVQAITGSSLIEMPAVAATSSTGAVAFTSGTSAVPADGVYVTVSDGTRTVTFEFDSDNSLALPSATRVVIGTTAKATADNLVTAVQNSTLHTTAVAASTANGASIALTQTATGVAGNTTIVTGTNGTVVGATVVATSFTGGTDAAVNLTATVANTVSAINAADMGIYASLDETVATMVKLTPGARLVISAKPTASDTFVVNVSGVATTYTFVAAAHSPVVPTEIVIGTDVPATLVNVLAAFSGSAAVATYGYTDHVLFSPLVARNISIVASSATAGVLSVIPTVVDDSTATSNGNVAITAINGLSGVTLAGFTGGTDATASIDHVTVAWATAGDAFATGTARLADGVAVTTYKGIKVSLASSAALPAKGSVTVHSVPVTTNTVTVTDGIVAAPLVFEFTNVAPSGSNIAVAIGATVEACATNLANAISSTDLQLTVSATGATVALTAIKTGPGPENKYNSTLLTNNASALKVVGMAGGAMNYTVGDKYTATVYAPRVFTVALDNRTVNLTVEAVGVDGDATAVKFLYESNTAEGSFGAVLTDSASGGYVTLPGHVRLAARNIVGANRWTAGDKYTVTIVNNEKIYWTLNKRTVDTFTTNDVSVDRNGSVTGTYGAFYVTLANTPFAGTALTMSLGGVAFTKYQQLGASAIYVLSIESTADLADGLSVAYTYSGNEPVLGESYYLSGQYKRPASYYNTPKIFYDAPSAAAFLAPVTTDNDLAIMVDIAFSQNNTPQAVAIIQVQDSDGDGSFSPADITNALAGAKTVSWITDLVPLRLFSYWSKFLAFNVSSCDPFEKREHSQYFGVPVGTAIGDNGTKNSIVYLAKTTLQVYGKSYAHGTRVMVAPRSAQKAVTLYDGTVSTVTLDGSFVAGGVAACIASMPTYSEALLKTQLLGFDYIETFGVSNNIILGGAGTIFFSDAGNGVYVFEEDQTTDTYASEFHEILPMRTKQDVTRIVRDAMNSGLVGVVSNTAGDAVALVHSFLLTVLRQLITKGITAPYQDANGNARAINDTDVKVFVDSSDPTLYNFYYAFYTRYSIKRLYGLYQVNKDLAA